MTADFSEKVQNLLLLSDDTNAADRLAEKILKHKVSKEPSS